MNLFYLSLKLLRRNWRSGELSILLAALVLAVTALTAIYFYTDRIGRGLEQQAVQLLGGDLVIKTPNPQPKTWLQQTQKLQLRTVQRYLFPSMVVANQQLQLASIKAVNSNYPLYGNITINKTSQTQAVAVNAIPAPGNVWVDSRLLTLLNIKLGSDVTIGAAKFKVNAVINTMPDTETNWLNIAPTVLMNVADLAKTQIIQPGSRVSYELLIAGNEEKIKQFKTWLQPQLTPEQKIFDVKNNQFVLKNNLQKADSYLTLANMICVLLSGLAIVITAQRYVRRRYDTTALLRCLGIVQKQIIYIYAYQLFIIGLIGSIIGCFLGYLFQLGFALIFTDWLKFSLPAAHLSSALTGLMFGFTMLLGFALSPFLSLQQITALRILRCDLKVPTSNNLWVYGLIICAVYIVLWQQTANHQLALWLLSGISFTAAILYSCANGLIKLLRMLGSSGGINWRYGIANLARYSRTSTVQLVAFGLVIMVLLLITLIRNDLLNTWQENLPKNTPNYFVINIQPVEVTQVEKLLAAYQIKSTGIYPMVRGRLTELNGIAIQQAVPPEARNHNALNRELNLSWASLLPKENKITQGQWWIAQDEGKPIVSLENKLAEELGIKLGDKLSFQIGEQKITAIVVSLRSLEWSSFQPNFYIIFPTGVINHLPTTYITSFYVDIKHRQVINELTHLFPGTTIIDVASILEQVRDMIDKIALAIEYLLLFTLLAGIVVLYAVLHANRDERLQQMALLRTLGANQNQLKIMVLAEFITLGLLAGTLGALSATLIAFIIASKIFNLGSHFNLWVIVMGLLAGTSLVGLIGYWATRRIVTVSPLQVLRNG